MDDNLKPLYEEKGKIYEEVTSIMEGAKAENRDMDADEDAKVDALIDKHTKKGEDIKRAQAVNEMASDKVEKIEEKADRAGKSVDQLDSERKESRRLLNQYLKYGENHMKREDLEDLKAIQAVRAQSSSVDTEGGFTVDEEIEDEITRSLLEFGGMRRIAKVIRTTTGGVLNFVTNNDTANVGEWLSENSAASQQDTVFGNVALNAWKASSDYMLVSRELAQDSSIDMVAYVTELMVERIGRLTSTGYVAGTGSSQPNGIRDASDFGAVTDVTVVVDFDDLLDLKHSVDPAYRNNGTWMLNDTVLRDLKKAAIASANQSLWQPGIIGGEPDTIDGDTYTIDQAMPDIAVNSHSVLYGDFKKYVIRDVTGVEILRSDQLNMLSNQLTFVGFMRTDGDLIDTAAVKHLRTDGT